MDDLWRTSEKFAYLIGECFLIIYKQNGEIKYAITNMEEEQASEMIKKTWEIEICHR